MSRVTKKRIEAELKEELRSSRSKLPVVFKTKLGYCCAVRVNRDTWWIYWGRFEDKTK